MKENELLDDDFGAYRGVLTDEELKSLEGKIPYGVLRGDALADICSLLDENQIDYTLQPKEATTNGTGIIPLASTQLNLVDTLVYVEAKKKTEADLLVEQYEATVATKAAEAPPQEKNAMQFYLWSAVFLLAVLWFAFSFLKFK